jgi:glycosyltransferase involved in cell wall biosynthesis
MLFLQQNSFWVSLSQDETGEAKIKLRRLTKQKYIEFTPEVTIINNPVNKQKFFSIPKLEKESLLKENQLQDKIVYLWLSHDREKKGLNIVLNAWKDWNKSPDEAQLLVVGAKRSEKINGVQFIGQVPSDLVDKYYKMAHVYLFPTLCKEGFGLSLAQAMCCGCFSIAANNGGVSDFFNSENGKIFLGKDKGAGDAGADVQKMVLGGELVKIMEELIEYLENVPEEILEAFMEDYGVNGYDLLTSGTKGEAEALLSQYM